MGFNLLELTPHKVSRDLSGYITYVYGKPKTGKTTTAGQFPKALILAFEKGYSAIPNILVKDINTLEFISENGKKAAREMGDLEKIIDIMN